MKTKTLFKIIIQIYYIIFSTLIFIIPIIYYSIKLWSTNKFPVSCLSILDPGIEQPVNPESRDCKRYIVTSIENIHNSFEKHILEKFNSQYTLPVQKYWNGRFWQYVKYKVI